MVLRERLGIAARAGAVHFLASTAVVSIVAVLVFFIWYPYPYRDLAGGRQIFNLLMVVDLVCGPLLTMVLFDKAKPKGELLRDLFLVVLIQCSALGYGMVTVWKARPLFLVMEVDRFNVIAAPDLQSPEASAELEKLSSSLKPKFFGPPIVVAIRAPKNEAERKTVMLESIAGGRDYSRRPDFYVAYDGDSARQSLLRSKPLSLFLAKWPNEQSNASSIAAQQSNDVVVLAYVPVVGRQDWIAVLDRKGQIQGFLKGDGF